MPRKRTLIPSLLEWTDRPLPVPPPVLPVIAERGGTQLRRPLPVAIIDTRESRIHFPFVVFAAGLLGSRSAVCPWEITPSRGWNTPA